MHIWFLVTMMSRAEYEWVSTFGHTTATECSFFTIQMVADAFQWVLHFWNFLYSVAVLPGWHGVAESATPKKARATPQATPNENMNFGTCIVYTLYIWKLLVPPLAHPTPPLEPPQIQMCRTATVCTTSTFYIFFGLLMLSAGQQPVKCSAASVSESRFLGTCCNLDYTLASYREIESCGCGNFTFSSSSVRYSCFGVRSGISSIKFQFRQCPVVFLRDLPWWLWACGKSWLNRIWQCIINTVLNVCAIMWPSYRLHYVSCPSVCLSRMDWKLADKETQKVKIGLDVSHGTSK